MTNKEDLKRLGEMFIKSADEYDWDEPYDHQARTQEYRDKENRSKSPEKLQSKKLHD